MKLALLLVALSACNSCKSTDTDAQRAKNVIDLAAYQSALDDCRERGKAAKSYDVYEACAVKADAKFGKDGGK